MSSSVKRVVSLHDNRILERRKLMDSYKSPDPSEIITDYIGITKPSSGDKIHGFYCPVGKILIEIYMKYRDYPGSGDKVVFYAALKTVLQRQLPQNLAPYPAKRPEDPIDAVISPISIEARMVTSILHVLFGNKCVWGLKEKIRSIYESYSKTERNSPKPSSKRVIDGESFNLFNTLKNLGYSDSEISPILFEEGLQFPGDFGVTEESSDLKKTKNLYIALYNVIEGANVFTSLIKEVSHSVFSHASWAIDSSGTFHSMNISSLESIFTENGGLAIEELNTLQSVKSGKARFNYSIYKYEVTETEYNRAVKLWKEQLYMNFHYSIASILEMGIKLLSGGSNSREFFKGFNENDLELKQLVCSTYVITSLCLCVPSIYNYFKANNYTTKNITPGNILKIRGVKHLFDGKDMIPFDNWKKLYERKHGPLPN
jgi:hypothetical protein